MTSRVDVISNMFLLFGMLFVARPYISYSIVFVDYNRNYRNVFLYRLIITRIRIIGTFASEINQSTALPFTLVYLRNSSRKHGRVMNWFHLIILFVGYEWYHVQVELDPILIYGRAKLTLIFHVIYMYVASSLTAYLLVRERTDQCR